MQLANMTGNCNLISFVCCRGARVKGRIISYLLAIAFSDHRARNVFLSLSHHILH